MIELRHLISIQLPRIHLRRAQHQLHNAVLLDAWHKQSVGSQMRLLWHTLEASVVPDSTAVLEAIERPAISQTDWGMRCLANLVHPAKPCFCHFFTPTIRWVLSKPLKHCCRANIHHSKIAVEQTYITQTQGMTIEQTPSSHDSKHQRKNLRHT